MQNIEPVSGWSLNYIAALDLHVPGFAGAYIRAGAERRQVIAALLSCKQLPAHPAEAVALGDFISRAAHREMLASAFGDIPKGLRGALARAGAQPHPRAFYGLLFRLLASDDKTLARAVMQMKEITPRRLLVLERLSGDLRSPTLIELIENPAQARDVVKLVNLLSSNGIDRAALAQALRGVSSREELASLWQRWARKLRFPRHPVPSSASFLPIESAAALHQTGLKYRNCLRHYLVDVMEGEAAFAEFTSADGEAVVHLSRNQIGWTLTGLWGKRNADAGPLVEEEAKTYLQKHGIKIIGEALPEGEWAVLARLSRRRMHFE